VERSGKRLAVIYATHGHGDHWFGTAQLIDRIPGAVPYATEGTIRMMHKQATLGREQMWDKAFPGQIPATPVLARPIRDDGFLLEGNILGAYEAGHIDTDGTTFLHVPSIDLVVAGDVAYNDVHPYILEGRGGGLVAWLGALDRIAGLEPRAVVAGHKNQDRPDNPAIIDETRQYLRDVQRLLDEKPTAREFFDRMMRIHGDRLNPGPCGTARSACSGPEPSQALVRRRVATGVLRPP
jgi:glyoxylase-like metal-dependent hydrolase (beta-lactamase superfamily II)